MGGSKFVPTATNEEGCQRTTKSYNTLINMCIYEYPRKSADAGEKLFH